LGKGIFNFEGGGEEAREKAHTFLLVEYFLRNRL